MSTTRAPAGAAPRQRGVRPLDPRLLHHAGAARRYVVLTAALGVTTAVLVVVQALLLAAVIAPVVLDGAGWADVRRDVAALAVVLLARAAVSWTQERFGQRAATAVVRQLRTRLLAHVRALGPAALDDGRGPALTTLVTRGLDALDGYLVRYLPQLLLAATVTPGLLAVVLWKDPVSAAIIAGTIPLVPVFMALIGLATQAQADRRLRSMQRLGGQVLDLVAGLPTLRALGRDAGQARRVREVGDAYRRATMRTLRTAFMSALVLETLTTICVALVAVGIGLRLLSGRMDFETGLAVLVLAPEVYLPLRLVGLHFHASTDGLAAAGEAFDVLETVPDRPLADGGRTPAGRVVGVRLEGVGVRHAGRARQTPHDLHLELRPGRVTALAGANGAGKSTAVEVLLGLRTPTSGRVLVSFADGSEHPLAELDAAGWWRRLAWVPQRPVLVPGTLEENVRLVTADDTPGADGRTDGTDLAAAAAATGLDALVPELPDGWATVVGAGGTGLSAGQRQRLALARALLRPAEVVVLDEPTAHLDAATEQVVHATVRRLRDEGRAVLLVAHRPSLLAVADEVVVVTDEPAPSSAGPVVP